MPLSSGLLSIVKVTLINPETGKSVNTCALQDTGSTVTLIDKKSQIKVEFVSKGMQTRTFWNEQCDQYQ